MDEESQMQGLYDQAMEVWINPELIRRAEKGEVELPVVLHTAQIIFGLDGTSKVRINDETKGIFKAVAQREIKKGEYLTYQDVENLHFSELHEDDQGYGHITLVSNSKDKWNISFSFIYGTEKVRSYLNLGSDFLESAKNNIESSKRVSVTLAMTAAENLIKARIAASPVVPLSANTHSGLLSLYGQFIRLNQKEKISKPYVKSYKYFKDYFNDVRYSTKNVSIHKSSLKKHLRQIELLKFEVEGIVNQIEMSQKPRPKYFKK